MTSQDCELLTSIVGWIDQIPYAELDQETFADDFIRLGVASVLIDLGEIAQGLSEEARAVLPDVPWGSVVGMRHVLAHETERVDYAKVWAAVEDLPRIRGLITLHISKFCP